MSVILLFNIATTFLFARLRQSLVAAIGVTFGIGVFIALVSFMTGLNKLLDNLILNRTPHILLYNEIKPNPHQPINLSSEYKLHYNFINSIKPKNENKEIHNSIAIIKSLKEKAEVEGIAPKITAPVFYKAGTININGTMFGIDSEAENKILYFNDYVIKGKPKDLDAVRNSIILGKGLAEKMLVDVGDEVQVSTPEGNELALKVVGIFQLGIADIDNVQSYSSLQTTQKLLGEPVSYITDIQIKLYDLNLSSALAKKFSSKYNTDARDIISSNAQFETGSSIRNIITYSVSVVLLIVAGFGIYNILNMMIYEKMDSIAILKATGFSGKDVKKIFLYLSMTIGITGGLSGLVLGFFGSVIIDQIPFETISLPAIKTFPVNYNPVFYFIGIVFALVTTYVAGYFPAQKASKIDPVVIIRGK
jgi:lipoprotein-releasing system permease protein